MCCLWDTSNKKFGDMNFYDRTNDIWYDEKLKNNFYQISRGKYIKPKDYIINTNFKSTYITDSYNYLVINFENKKVLKIFINASLTGVLFVDFELIIETYNKNYENIEIDYGKDNMKKQYDGTYNIIIDVSRIECYYSIEANVLRGMKYHNSYINATPKDLENYPFEEIHLNSPFLIKIFQRDICIFE